MMKYCANLISEFFRNWSRLPDEGIEASICVCLATVAQACDDILQRGFDSDAIFSKYRNGAATFEGNDG